MQASANRRPEASFPEPFVRPQAKASRTNAIRLWHSRGAGAVAAGRPEATLPISVVVPRNTLFLRDVPVFGGRLEDHARGKLVDHAALNLLPRRLMGGIAIPPVPLQLLLPPRELGIV